MWHGLNRNQWHNDSEIGGTNRTELATISRNMEMKDGQYLIGVKKAREPLETDKNEPVSEKETKAEIKQFDESLIEEVINSIGLLEDDNQEHWTAEGLPQVKAIEEIMDANISASDRDEAFKRIKEGGKDNGQTGSLFSRFFSKNS